MSTILIEESLSPQEISQLEQEFPHCHLVLSEKNPSLNEENYAQIDILFTNKLSVEELKKFHRLRWIHIPSAFSHEVCLKEIEEQGNILVTHAKEENAVPTGEFAIGVALAFSKNLFHWFLATHSPHFLKEYEWYQKMWQLKGRVFLQIGLENLGSEIAKRASQLNLKVWGVQDHATFHPHCEKNYSYEDLPQLLPLADIICLSSSRRDQKVFQLTKKELDLLKPRSILLILGSSKGIKETDLLEVIKKKEFQGILLDVFPPIDEQSPLRNLPNILITPYVSEYPKIYDTKTFQLFHYNLRQFLYGNFSDMKNRIDKMRSSLMS